MGNAESVASAAKATMQVNKLVDNVGKGFENLTSSGKKKEDSAEKQSASSEGGGGIMNIKLFDHQRRQSAISKE